jgi:TonB family protein
MTGMPRVTFAIDGGGGVSWVRLASSCGNRILDDAAVATVRRAAPLPYYPTPITLAVKYSLGD